MHYKLYSTEDFIQDEFFQQWVLSPNEERDHYWSSFLLHYPGQHEKIDQARAFLLAMNFQRHVPETVLRTIKSNFNAAIDEHESVQYEHANRNPGPLRPRSISIFSGIAYPVAASLLFCFFFAGYLLVQKDVPFKILQTFTLEKQQTPQGKKRHIILEDGTQVWLNADSEIQYAKSFLGTDNREVFLQGEAFFDVVENNESPFIVRTAELSIRVLGTAFNVKAYAQDIFVETTLVRGKVTLASSTSEDSLRAVTLLPNQQALYRKDSKSIALEETVNASDYFAWRDGWMIFDDKPFSMIKETLERWYDVSIAMEDEKSLSCTYSARFKDKTLTEVLEIFRNTEAINYRIEGRQVYIYGELCQYVNP